MKEFPCGKFSIKLTTDKIKFQTVVEWAKPVSRLHHEISNLLVICGFDCLHSTSKLLQKTRRLLIRHLVIIRRTVAGGEFQRLIYASLGVQPCF